MKRALLVIDVQNEYFSGALPVTYPEHSLERITQAIDAANEADIPVVLIQHGDSEGTIFRKESAAWQLHPEVAQRKHELLLEKNLPGSFTGTPLEAWLRERGIDTVVVSGYMTQMCCDTTARQASHLGFTVEFLSDATGTLQFSNSEGTVDAQSLHNTTLIVQQSGFSQVKSTREWINETRGS